MKMLSLNLSIILILCQLFQNGESQHDPHFLKGRTTIVHLFDWRWIDIAQECERFLGPYGYAGVQTSPVNENAIVMSDTMKRPWWERYQPVSYKLDETRSGNEAQFRDMVKRCNAVGVRIYVDAVINHMTGSWASGKGTGGSSFDSQKLIYEGVPYTEKDFNGPPECSSETGSIENYDNATEVRNCMLSGLKDLNQNKTDVRGKIVHFLNTLISFGVAGFRIDGAKHMWPEHIKAIVDKLDNLTTTAGFSKNLRPFIYQEVIDFGGEGISSSDYVNNGRITEFKYGNFLAENFRYHTIKNFVNFGSEWGMVNSNNALVFIDNHDNQRGHGGGGDILTFREARLYKMATAFMLSWPFGITRVMSSFYWDQKIVDGHDENDWVGPPVDENYNTLPVTVNKDLTCGNGWICEHRWRQMYNMVHFRNLVEGTSVDKWWDNGDNQIAFCRGTKGFVAINNEGEMNVDLQTCLPKGVYCDVISGNLIKGKCTGKTISVKSDGMASIKINSYDEDGVIAIHIEAKE